MLLVKLSFTIVWPSTLKGPNPLLVQRSGYFLQQLESEYKGKFLGFF